MHPHQCTHNRNHVRIQLIFHWIFLNYFFKCLIHRAARKMKRYSLVESKPFFDHLHSFFSSEAHCSDGTSWTLVSKRTSGSWSPRLANLSCFTCIAPSTRAPRNTFLARFTWATSLTLRSRWSRKTLKWQDDCCLHQMPVSSSRLNAKVTTFKKILIIVFTFETQIQLK